MIKKYWKWQFSRWWPLLLIFGVVITATFFFTCTLESITNSQGYNGRIGYPREFSAAGVELFVFLAAMMVPVFVMPLMVFSYRTKKQSADIFYQAAYKPGTIKRIRLLLGLIIIVGVFTFAYILGIAILGIRFAATPEFAETVYGETTITTTRGVINFPVYILAYFLLLTIIIGQYFVNCFLVGLGDYVLDQIFLLICGNVILCLGFYAPYLYIAHGTGLIMNNPGIRPYESLFAMPSFVSSWAFIANPMINWIRGVDSDWRLVLANSIGHSVFVLFSTGLCVANMLGRDPSGEYANLRGARNPAISLIPHGMAFCLGILFDILLANGVRAVQLNAQIAMPIFTVVLFASGYYAILSLWRHSFRPSKVDLISFISVNATIDVLLILLIVLNVTVKYPVSY